VLLEDFPFHRRVRARAYVQDLRDEFEFKSEGDAASLAGADEAGCESAESAGAGRAAGREGGCVR